MKDHVMIAVEIGRFWNGHGWTADIKQALLLTFEDANALATTLTNVARPSLSKRTFAAVPFIDAAKKVVEFTRRPLVTTVQEVSR